MSTLLRRGSRGAEVQKLQLALHKQYQPCELAPILNPGGSADGHFGPVTSSWVHKFQRTNPPLKADGIAGPNTMKALYGVIPVTPAVDGSDEDEPSEKSKKVGLDPNKPVSDLTEEKRKQLIEDLLDNVPAEFKDSVFNFLSKSLTTLGFGMKIGQLGALFASSTSILLWAGPASVPLTAASSIFSIISAWDTNEEMYATRAWAYTVTAWVFNEKIPSSSPTMMQRFRANKFEDQLQDTVDGWQNMSRETWSYMQSLPNKYGYNKEQLQCAYRLELSLKKGLRGGNEKEKFCYSLLRKRESTFSGIDLTSWIDGYNVLYPR